MDQNRWFVGPHIFHEKGLEHPLILKPLLKGNCLAAVCKLGAY